MRIGFIGLGNMGGPMALNVLKAGHTMVVTDLRHELAKPHIDLGAKWADTAKAVAQASEVVFTSLPGPREVEAVALGAGGVLEGAARGTVYVDLSHELGDVDPSHPCRLCRAWRRRAGRTRQRRRTGRALGQARGAGRRRRGSLQADQARARRDRRQGDVGRRDRLRHRREARAQHGVRMLAHGDRRGHDLGGQGRRGARGAARRPFQELVRPGPRAEGHDPEHRVPRRLRRRELRAQAPGQGRRASHRAGPRIPRRDDGRAARRAAARGSAAARLGRQRLDDVLPRAGRARRRRASHEETGGLIMADALSAILESKEAERLATGFVFTEGPLWHPDGFYYFVDIRRSNLHKLTPGKEQELVRSNTGEGNGTTVDLQGRLVICEGGNRRVTRWTGGQSEVLMDRFQGKRLNPPNDVVCKSDGSIYFTDPGLRVPLAERELASAGVYRIAPDGKTSLVADCEYPNGLAFSPDERVLYVANTRWAQYIHALEIDPDGKLVRRRIFADMSSDETDGVPDGMKVDVEGRVFCTGPGGTWVFAPDGTRLGIIRTPEVPANLAFRGSYLRTLFFTARTSVYPSRMKVPGVVQPRFWS